MKFVLQKFPLLYICEWALVIISPHQLFQQVNWTIYSPASITCSLHTYYIDTWQHRPHGCEVRWIHWIERQIWLDLMLNCWALTTDVSADMFLVNKLPEMCIWHTVYLINFNSLWLMMPYGIMELKSALVRVMAWCLTAPSHYPNQCWLIISSALHHSHHVNNTGNAHESNHCSAFKN